MPIPFLRRPYRQGTPSWINEQILTLDNFGGGLNNVEPDTIIADNELADSKNMRFVGATLMEKRQGIRYVDETGLPNLTAPITWIDKFYPVSGDPQFVRATATELYIGGTKICNVSGNVRGCTYVGRYYFVDGSALRVYDGETYYKVITEPFSYPSAKIAKDAVTFTVDKIPEQTKVGDKVTFISTILEAYDGDLSTIVRTITAINTSTRTITIDSAIGYEILASRDSKKNPIYFFEPLGTAHTYGEEVWDKENHLAYYLPCVFQLADEYAGSSYIPDKPNLITVHGNRIFLAGDSKSPNSVFMSVHDTISPQPLYYPAAAGISVKPNGQSIVDMVVFDDALIIGRNEDMYVLYGDTEYPSTIVPSGTQFYIKQMDVATGFMNVDCGALLNNYYIFLGYDGRFYSLNTPTTYVEYLMTRPLAWKCDIYSAPFSIEKNSTVTTSVTAYRNEVLFSINNDLVVVYSYDNMAYTYYTGWKNSCLYSDGIKLYIGRQDGKFVKWCDDEEYVYDDLGAKISCTLRTKRFDLGMSANFKYFKRFMLTSQAYDEANSNITVEFEIDYYGKEFEDGLSIASNKGRYGVSEWGKAVFGDMDILKSRWINLDVRGRTIQFAFLNETLSEPMRIYDLNVLWGIRDVR